jgi:hypothetical protein
MNNVDKYKMANIKIGDKFQDEDTDIWTVTKIERNNWEYWIDLESEDGSVVSFPEDMDGGEFFEWFYHNKNKLKK